MVDGTVSREMFLKDYASVFDGDHRWKGLDVPEGELFAWDEHSTYVRKQTFFLGPAWPQTSRRHPAPRCWRYRRWMPPTVLRQAFWASAGRRLAA